MLLRNSLLLIFFLFNLTGCLDQGSGSGKDSIDVEAPEINYGQLKVRSGKSLENSMNSQKISLKGGKGNQNSNGAPKDSNEPNKYDHVWITVVEVSVKRVNEDWLVINTNEMKLDLVALAENATAVLADQRLPVGHYEQLRLKLTEDSTVVVNGEEHPIKTPSASQSGLKIKTLFTIQKGLITEFALNFDPNESIVEKGNGSFSLKPVIDVEGIEEDLTPPSIAIVPLNKTYINTSTPKITVNYLDPYVDPSSFSILYNGYEFKDAFNIGLTQATSEAELVDGNYIIKASISDLAPNHAESEPISFIVDTTAPEVNVTAQENYKTNNSAYPIQISINELYIDKVRISQNGIQIYESSDSSISVTATLLEGDNVFEVYVSDKAGNSSVKNLENIFLDTIPPMLTIEVPEDDDTIYDYKFTVIGESNEELISASAGGQPLQLSEDKMSFEGVFNAPVEGDNAISIRAVDTVGNEAVVVRNVFINPKLLNVELITIGPDLEDPSKIIITGGEGAVRPNVDVTIKTGFFNSTSFVSGDKGVFSVKMDYFSSAQIIVEDDERDESDEGVLTYNVETIFSGIVKGIDELPLPGVHIFFVSNPSIHTFTDQGGRFSFTNPPLGDQDVLVDGRTIPTEIFKGEKTFSISNVAVTIGTRQTNVLTRPIYLAPLMRDGSETDIEDGAPVTVTSLHAPGVQLTVPTNAATFPDGTKSGSINAAIIESEKVTVKVPEFSKPSHVVALEPSGLSFEEPVELILPNNSEFPADLPMVIMSKNSKTGRWEIDGYARVSSNGSEIITEPGKGITHFSEVYASPIGPIITEQGNSLNPGVNTLDGNVSTSIQLPSFKSRGADVTPSLTYKSTWAKPGIVVSNIVSLPREEHYFDLGFGSGIKIWAEPEYVEAQFITKNYVSDTMKLEGLVDDSIVSYAFDFQNDIESGRQPYLSKFNIHYKDMTLTTRTSIETDSYVGGNVVDFSTQVIGEEYEEIKRVFPSDVSGNFYVQNKINSSAGRGWKINGVSQLLNKNSSRVTIENEDGSLNTYSLNNNISTLYRNTNITGVDIRSISDITIFDNSNNTVRSLDANSGTTSYLGTISDISAIFRDNINIKNRHCNFFGCWTDTTCQRDRYQFQRDRQMEGILKVSDDLIFVTDKLGMLYKLENGNFYNVVNGYTNVPTSHEKDKLSWFLNLAGKINVNYSKTFANGPCGWIASSGSIQDSRHVDGSFSGSRFSSPLSIVEGYGEKSIIVADSGAHRVKKVNLNTGQVYTIVGKGKTYDDGDGGLAYDANIRHPRGLAYDNEGNLYISSERGLIRKVDQNGYISTIAGQYPVVDGAPEDDSAPARKMVFNNPYGMVVDNVNKYLYVADTGNDRVVQINLTTGMAKTVAGDHSCRVDMGDGASALNASICSPKFVGLDDNNNLLIYDAGHNAIRRVLFTDSSIGEISYSPANVDGSVLKKKSDGSFEQKYRNGTLKIFNADGKHVRTISRSGNEIVYSYVGDDISTITNDLGQTISYDYSNGRLARITDPAGRKTTFNFIGDDLTSVVFPDGTKKSFEYKSNGLMIQESNQNNVNINYVYNEWNRLQKIIRNDGEEIIINDSKSATVANNYSGGASGQFKSANDESLADGITDAKGNTTKLNQNQDGYISKITDAAGRITKIERNSWGSPTKIIRPDETFVEFEYDIVTRDLVLKYDSATGNAEAKVYDSFGNIVEETTGTGLFTKRTYDANGFLKELLSPSGQKTQFTYYSNGLLATKTKISDDSDEYLINYSYDSQGNLTQMTDSRGQEMKYTYDNAGNVLSKSAKVSSGNYQTTYNSYDQFNRLKAVDTPNGELTTYNYTFTGQLLSIVDPRGKVTSYAYNDFDQVISKSNPQGQTWYYDYDANGNMTYLREPNGQVKSFEYDKLNQLAKKTLPDDVYVYDYDIRGNMVSVENNSSVIEFEVDVAGRMVSNSVSGKGSMSNYPSYSLSYTYDANDSRLSMSDSFGGTTTYTYTEDAKLKSINNHKGEVFNMSYDDHNRLTQISGPKVTASFNFSNSSFINSIVHNNGLTDIASFNYTRNDLGFITQMSSNIGVEQFTYDSNNQLKSASHPSSTHNGDKDFSNETFNYDAIGNRTSDNFGSFTYNDSGYHLEQDYNHVYMYDQNGNMVYKKNKNDNSFENYSYTSENQLKKIEFFTEGAGSPFKTANYYFDAIGRRMAKVVVDNNNISDKAKTFTRYFAYDNQEIIATFNEQKSLLARYTHSGLRTDDVLAVDVTSAGVVAKVAQSAGTYYYLKDHLGTIKHVANAAGTIIQNINYSAYGVITSIKDHLNSTLATPILEVYHSFTGREYDAESGLYYYRARFYDASIGRFLQIDPDPGKLMLPITFVNKYTYTGNSPLNRVDPKGMSFLGDLVGYLSLVVRGMLDLNMGWLLKDPALMIGGLAMLAEFVLGPINLLVNGRLPKLTMFNGRPAIENSYLSDRVARPGFSLGPAMFLRYNSDREELLNTKKHEYGHYLQYKEWGGWLYLDIGWKEKGECTRLELDADRRAKNYFEDFIPNYGGSCGTL